MKYTTGYFQKPVPTGLIKVEASILTVVESDLVKTKLVPTTAPLASSQLAALPPVTVIVLVDPVSTVAVYASTNKV